MALKVVGGGSRSGKSRYALELARAAGPRRVFLATAKAGDEEMRARIERHRMERDTSFTTVEEPVHLKKALADCEGGFDVIVIDCLTLWVSNLMMRGAADGEILPEAEALFRAAAACPAPVIVVTNEVGCGLVPENELARRFRDLVGWINQEAVRAADEAWYMAFGCPLRLK